MKEQDYYNNRWKEEGAAQAPPNKERIDLVSTIASNWITRQSIKEPRILDIGCGNGWILEALYNRLGEKCRLYGIEPSTTGVKNSISKVPSATVRQGTLSECDFDPIFNVIVCSEVFEHVDEKKIFIDEISNLLLPGGYLVMTTPNGKYRDTYFEKCDVRPQPVENWVSRTELQQLINNCFLKTTTDTFELDYFYRTHPNTKTAGRNLWKLKGGWRLWQYIERIMKARFSLGLYLIVTAEKPLS